MDQKQKDRLIAGTCTAIILVLLTIVLTTLYYRTEINPLEERRWPPVDSSEIVFGGEYVKLGDIPLPQEVQDNSPLPQDAPSEPTVEGTDLDNGGEPAQEAPQLVSSAQESPMKVQEKPKPEKTGPTKEEIAERERIKREKEEAAKQAKIKDRLKSGFSSSSKGSGKSGSPNGNSSTGALSGQPGHNLKGRTAESWGKPRSTLSGTIRVQVSVNRQGYVTDAAYAGGTGPAAANAGVRESCVNASRHSRFSVDLEATATQKGIITWRFE